MKRVSAGLLMFRHSSAGLEFLLVHPGGPFWQKKDLGSWSIPKGEYIPEEEEPFKAAKREFEEETGIRPVGEFIALGEIRQPSGKTISAWAVEGDCSPQEIRSNTFSMEWPPKSGTMQEFPEIDRAEWFSPEEARRRISKGQLGFLDRLFDRVQLSNQEQPLLTAQPASSAEVNNLMKTQAKSASALIDERIKELADWRGKTLARVRSIIHAADPEIVEEWKWMGTPVFSHAGIVCTGETYKNVVKMTFAKGAALKDPARLFNSSLEGNVRRAIDIREGEKINEAALKALIREAVALNLAGKSAPKKKPKASHPKRKRSG